MRVSVSVTVSNLAQHVAAHKPRLVHVAVDAVDMTLAGILPHLEVATVVEHRYALGVLGNHQLVAVELAREVGIVEVGEGIEQRLAMVGALNEADELEQRVAEVFCRQSALGLDVNHGDEVLVLGAALGHEVGQLAFLRHHWTVEVVGAHFQPIAVGQVYVALIFIVDCILPSVALRYT